MQRVHLKIRILSPLCEKLTFDVKSDSVIPVEFDWIIDKIFDGFETVWDSRCFWANLFYYYQEYLKYSYYENWKFRCFTDSDIVVPLSVVWLCLPNYLSKKYFKYDKMIEKYVLRDSFLLHLQ